LAFSTPPAGQTWNLYYYADGKRVAERQMVGSTSWVYYLVGDHLGSASVVLDSNRNVVAEQRYYPYGEAVTVAGTQPTNYQFTGQLRDSYINQKVVPGMSHDEVTAALEAIGPLEVVRSNRFDPDTTIQQVNLEIYLDPRDNIQMLLSYSNTGQLISYRIMND
jgi:hypothetical protein